MCCCSALSLDGVFSRDAIGGSVDSEERMFSEVGDEDMVELRVE